MDNNIEQIRALARAKHRLSVILTTIMIVVYFSFMVLVDFHKAWLGVEIVPGLTRGILIGAGNIVCAWLLTFIYVQWTNRVYDAGLDKLRGGKK